MKIRKKKFVTLQLIINVTMANFFEKKGNAQKDLDNGYREKAKMKT